MEPRIFNTAGVDVPVQPKEGKYFSLEELQAIVGGFIEMVFFPNGRDVMVVNEEGKLMGLPENTEATKMVSTFLQGDVIVGNVLVTDRKYLK